MLRRVSSSNSAMDWILRANRSHDVAIGGFIVSSREEEASQTQTFSSSTHDLRFQNRKFERLLRESFTHVIEERLASDDMTWAQFVLQ